MNALPVFTRSFSGVSDQKGQFGRKLKQLREKAGLSVYALAKRTKLTQSNIHRIENGERDPAWASAVKLAKALGVSMSEFDDVPDSDSLPPATDPTT